MNMYKSEIYTLYKDIEIDLMQLLINYVISLFRNCVYREL